MALDNHPEPPQLTACAAVPGCWPLMPGQAISLQPPGTVPCARFEVPSLLAEKSCAKRRPSAAVLRQGECGG